MRRDIRSAATGGRRGYYADCLIFSTDQAGADPRAWILDDDGWPVPEGNHLPVHPIDAQPLLLH